MYDASEVGREDIITLLFCAGRLLARLIVTIQFLGGMHLLSTSMSVTAKPYRMISLNVAYVAALLGCTEPLALSLGLTSTIGVAYQVDLILNAIVSCSSMVTVLSVLYELLAFFSEFDDSARIGHLRTELKRVCIRFACLTAVMTILSLLMLSWGWLFSLFSRVRVVLHMCVDSCAMLAIRSHEQGGGQGKQGPKPQAMSQDPKGVRELDVRPPVGRVRELDVCPRVKRARELDVFFPDSSVRDSLQDLVIPERHITLEWAPATTNTITSVPKFPNCHGTRR